MSEYFSATRCGLFFFAQIALVDSKLQNEKLHATSGVEFLGMGKNYQGVFSGLQQISGK
jgi:hypothetical protein